MSSPAKPRVIVLGGGLGGTIAAYELRQKLKDVAEIHLVSDSPQFSFVPSNPWVAVGWRQPDAIQIELATALARRQIGFTPSAVHRVSPSEKRLDLADGSSLPYDYLVIATGPDLAFDEIEVSARRDTPFRSAARTTPAKHHPRSSASAPIPAKSWSEPFRAHRVSDRLTNSR